MQKQLLNKEILKQFISDNRLNEVVKNLIFQLNEFLDKNKDDIDYEPIRKLSDTLIINSGKLKGLEQDLVNGIIDRETKRITTAEVQNAVLYIIDQLPVQFWDKQTNVKSSKEKTKSDAYNNSPNNQSFFKQESVNNENKKNISKIVIVLLFLIIVTFISIFIWNYNKSNNDEYPKTIDEITWENETTGFFTDIRDNHKYNVRRIGKQIWMIENLAFKPNNGKYWIYENNQANFTKFGYLYDWDLANSICPKGWKLPSKDEFIELKINLDTIPFNELISKNYFLTINSFGGWCQNDNSFHYINEHGNFWTETSVNENRAWRFNIDLTKKNFDIYDHNKKFGLSVRCIKINR